MTREEKIQTLLNSTERLIMNIQLNVPPEIFQLEGMQKLIKRFAAITLSNRPVTLPKVRNAPK